VSPDDPEEWIEAIRWIQNNKNRADKISHKAWEDVEKYSWDKRVEDIFSREMA
jgi:glycosyltransferase involved in cell wall biosynthesis